MKYRLMKNKSTGIRSIYNTKTKEMILESENPEVYKKLRKKALLNYNRSARNEAMRSLGLVSYRNQSGSVCWE